MVFQHPLKLILHKMHDIVHKETFFVHVQLCLVHDPDKAQDIVAGISSPFCRTGLCLDVSGRHWFGGLGSADSGINNCGHRFSLIVSEALVPGPACFQGMRSEQAV